MLTCGIAGEFTAGTAGISTSGTANEVTAGTTGMLTCGIAGEFTAGTAGISTSGTANVTAGRTGRLTSGTFSAGIAIDGFVGRFIGFSVALEIFKLFKFIFDGKLAGRLVGSFTLMSGM